MYIYIYLSLSLYIYIYIYIYIHTGGAGAGLRQRPGVAAPAQLGGNHLSGTARLTHFTNYDFKTHRISNKHLFFVSGQASGLQCNRMFFFDG